MKVLAREITIDDCPEAVASFGFGQPNKVRVTVGREYAVHAISLFKGVIFLQIINDLVYPAWYPCWFFEISDMTLPRDWICNLLNDDLQLIMGPSFIANSENSYDAMVQLETEPVNLFWERIKKESED